MAMDWKGLSLDAAGEGIKSRIGLLDTAAKLTLNTLYPNEFEVYMVTLELVDYKDTPIEYFTFPINPDQMTKTQPYTKQIDRTYGAVVVNKTGQFTPQDIVIKGTFGRQFRFVTRDKSLKDISWSGLLPWTEGTDGELEFNRYYKSGYGCFKIVQNICREANILDNGRARQLYFHNLALGESYLVEVLNFQAHQATGNNMIWGYDLRMKILSDVYDNNKWKTLGQRLATTAVTTAANTVAKAGKNILDSLLRSF